AGSMIRHAEVAERRGVICFESEDYAQAATKFGEALRAKGEDLTLRSNLGHALLRAKKFEAAQDEFARVLKAAPGHIGARLGAAQLCLELADDGDGDQYQLAEHHLTLALEYGRNRYTGSQRLQANEIANIYYQRGYAMAKRYESDGAAARSGALASALRDFQECQRADPGHTKAGPAIEKITRQIQLRSSERLVGLIGPLLIVVAALVVFVLAQLDFFFHDAVAGLLHAESGARATDSKSYIAI